MKLRSTLLLALTIIVFSCSYQEDYQTPDIEDQTDQKSIVIENIDENGITYSINSHSLDDLYNKRISYGGQEYMILKKNISGDKGFTEINERKENQVIIVSDFPQYGDIFVSANVREYVGGTFNSNGSYSCLYPSCSSVGGKYKQYIGNPSSSLLASVDYQGESKSNNYYCAAIIERYIGSSITYEPGNWQRVDAKFTASKPSQSTNCPSFADPIGKSTSRWINGYKYTSVFVGCDD